MLSGEQMRQFLQLLPVGFGFHPTDEQLVDHYLVSKIQGRNSHLKMEVILGNNNSQMDIIPEIDVCQYEPWELAAQLNHPVFSVLQTNDPEWYFFSTPQKKYPNGRRLKRATEEGFWKPTGPDRKIVCRATGKEIGTKKSLVFHAGRGSSAARTPWIIHEYHSSIPSLSSKETNTFLCRLKREVGPGFSPEPNLNRMSPDLPSNQASNSSITMEVGSSSATAGIHQSCDPANITATTAVGSINSPSDTKADKQEHSTCHVTNNWQNNIIPQKNDVLSGLKEDAGSDFPQETNLNRMSPDLPSVQEPVLTTMEIDNSLTGGQTEDTNLGASDMIYEENNIDCDAIINDYEDNMNSQIVQKMEDPESDFPLEPSLTTMEVDNSSRIHQTGGPTDNSDIIHQQNHIDWNAINYYEDDAILQDFDTLAESLAFDLGYGLPLRRDYTSKKEEVHSGFWNLWET